MICFYLWDNILLLSNQSIVNGHTQNDSNNDKDESYSKVMVIELVVESYSQCTE